MSRYELTWTWTSAAMSCHAALEELNADYTLRFIDLGQPWSEADLTLNPHRKLPTLVDNEPPDGDNPFVVYQSAAILLYLASMHPDAGLTPRYGSTGHARCLQRLFFMAEMLQPSFMMYYYPERSTRAHDQPSLDAVKAKAVEWIAELWGRIDAQMGEGNYMTGDDLSVCDLFAIPMFAWNDGNEDFRPIAGFPALSRLKSRLWERPAIARMLAAHVER